MDHITFEQVMELAAVVLILVGAYNAIITAIRYHREERRLRNGPVSQLTERVDRHDKLLERDMERLDAHDKQLKSMGEQSTIMLRGVRALLSHEINGNSDDRLKASASEIDEYLIGRK